jgi:hypothetical protein
LEAGPPNKSGLLGTLAIASGALAILSAVALFGWILLALVTHGWTLGPSPFILRALVNGGLVATPISLLIGIAAVLRKDRSAWYGIAMGILATPAWAYWLAAVASEAQFH